MLGVRHVLEMLPSYDSLCRWLRSQLNRMEKRHQPSDDCGACLTLQTKAELATLTNYLRDPGALAARHRRQRRDSPWLRPVGAELEERCDANTHVDGCRDRQRIQHGHGNKCLFFHTRRPCAVSPSVHVTLL